jgi:hypothetical protein
MAAHSSVSDAPGHGPSVAPSAPPHPARIRDAPADLPTHGCVRCGRPIPVSVALCELCNPLGLSQPAASQAHGTVFLAVGLAVVGLALLGRLALAGIGPFSGSVVAVAPTAGGLAVTLEVRNEGSRAGATTCRIYDPSVPGIGPESAQVLSPRIEPGQTVTFTKTIAGLGSTVRPLAAECRSR